MNRKSYNIYGKYNIIENQQKIDIDSEFIIELCLKKIF